MRQHLVVVIGVVIFVESGIEIKRCYEIVVIKISVEEYVMQSVSNARIVENIWEW